MADAPAFYPNSGVLFSEENKKNAKAPDLRGRLELGEDTVAYIVKQHGAGNKEISLELSGWKKVARSGSKFLSLNVKEPFKKADAAPKAAKPSQRAGFEDEEDAPPF